MTRRFVAFVALAVSCVTAAGCGGSAYHYVKNSSERTYFKVPREWKLFDEDVMIPHIAGDLPAQQQEAARRNRWVVGFDGAPKPAVDNVTVLQGAAHPTGIAQVVRLSPEESDIVSLRSLRNLVVNVDELATEDPGFDALNLEKISRRGFRGVNFVFNFTTEAGTTATLNQTALLDADAERLYLLLIGCESSCYERNKETIGEIADSWTVRER